MSDERTITGDEEQPRGGYAGSVIGLTFVALCGLMLFWMLLAPMAEPDPRHGPVFVSARDATMISYSFLAIGAWLGWFVFWLSGRQRRLASARAKERVTSPTVRTALCAIGLGWILLAAYGALGGSALGTDATAFVAFMSIAPVGFALWHVGYSTRERDRRTG